MERANLGYRLTTGLFCLAILPGAIGDLVQPEMVVEMMEAIDLPLYILTLIGIWKLLGVVALAMPRFRRINEWAYAGFFFDLTGAVWVHLAGGDPVSSVIPAAVLLVPLGASYMLRDAAESAAVAPATQAVAA